MFDAVAPTSVKVAGTAVSAGRSRDALGNLVPIRWMIGFPVPLEYGRFFRWMTGPCWKFLIGSGAFMADKAINPGGIAEIKILATPSVACMTGRATSLVAFDVDSEIVDGEPAFTQLRRFFGRWILPGPVNGIVDLCRRFRMTGKTGLSNLRA
mgnify:CR=1 FL=1